MSQSWTSFPPCFSIKRAPSIPLATNMVPGPAERDTAYSTVADIVPALGRRKARHAGADGGPACLPRPTARHPQDGLQLREAPLANQIGPPATFIQKHEPRGIPGRGGLLPRRPGLCHVRPGVFGRVPRFFQAAAELRDRPPDRREARRQSATPAATPPASDPVAPGSGSRAAATAPPDAASATASGGAARSHPSRAAAASGGRPTPDSPHTSPPPASTPCRRRCP